MTEQLTKTKDLPIIAAKEKGPGPGRYVLPSSVGAKFHDNTKKQKPAYSFGQRCDMPRPIYWIPPKVTRHGADGTRTHSMLGRQRSQKIFQTPGPGTYYPEKVWPPNEISAPTFSMGSRTKLGQISTTPSANSYTLPNMLGSKVPNKRASHSYTICSRGKSGGHADDLANTPGPGSYHPIHPDLTRKRPPAYSIQGRTTQVVDGTQKPGPGTYRPENVSYNNTRAPQYSMSIRHSEFTTPLIV